MDGRGGVRPAEGLREWVADISGCAAFDAITALQGGSVAELWRFDATADGRAVSIVAKQAAIDSPQEEIDFIGREAQVLEALQSFDLPVPEVLASDPHGICSGRAALLMTPVPGNLLGGEGELRAAIEPMARMLVRFHRATRDLLAGRRYRPWFDFDALEAPTWGLKQPLWQRGVDTAQRQAPPSADGFIHRDPHPGNMLFDGAQPTALLDWPNAGRGPLSADVGRMCLNLAVLLDVDAAAAFRGAWEDACSLRHDPLLDLYGLLEVHAPALEPHPTASAIGIPVAGREMVERLEAFLEDTLRRMSLRRGR